MNSVGYEIRTEHFQGPFDKLLEIIEAKQLEITALSLSEVTSDFLRYVDSLKTEGNIENDRDENSASSQIDLRLLSSFLSVAAKLILIKSRALLPEFVLTSEEEEDIENLEIRLRMYRQYKEASKHIAGLFQNERRFYKKSYLKGLPQGFYPPDELTKNMLWGSVSSVFAVLQEYVVEQRKITIDVIKIEEKISDIVARIKDRATLFFSDIAKDKPKKEVVVSFLALLELLRQHILDADQGELFGNIEIKNLESKPSEL